MASRETRRKIVIIGLAEGIADLIEQTGGSNPAAKTQDFAARIRSCSRQCFKLWPDQLTELETQRINKRIGELNRECFAPDGETGVAVLSESVLTLLNSLCDIETTDRRLVIEDLITVCQQVNQYYKYRGSRKRFGDETPATAKRTAFLPN